MNRLIKLFLIMLITYSCFNSQKGKEKELKYIKLHEIGFSLAVPNNYSLVDSKEFIQLVGKQSSANENLTSEKDNFQYHFLLDKDDYDKMIIIGYNKSLGPTKLYTSTVGHASYQLKEAMMNTGIYDGKNLEFEKSKLSRIPKLSFLKVSGKSDFEGIENIEAFLLSTNKHTLMVMANSDTELNLEKFIIKSIVY